jgi:hypothetical protein
MSNETNAAHRAAEHLARPQGGGLLKYVPAFLFVFLLFVIGRFAVADPMAPLLGLKLSWNDLLIVAAAMAAMAEQLRVSHPGIDNTVEAMAMAALAVIQILLFALGATGAAQLSMFNNAEFLVLTLISMSGAVVAILINARTLRRSIGFGDGGN